MIAINLTIALKLLRLLCLNNVYQIYILVVFVHRIEPTCEKLR